MNKGHRVLHILKYVVWEGLIGASPLPPLKVFTNHRGRELAAMAIYQAPDLPEAINTNPPATARS